MEIPKVLATRYRGLEVKPPPGVKVLLNTMTGKYYDWDGEKWNEREES